MLTSSQVLQRASVFYCLKNGFSNSDNRLGVASWVVANQIAIQYHLLTWVLHSLFYGSMLKSSFKTHSGYRTRKTSGFFVSDCWGSQPEHVSTKPIKLWNSSFFRGLSHLVYGVVDTTECARKGNKSGRLCAESETMPPYFILGGISLKRIGITIMNTLKCFHLAITQSNNEPLGHQQVYAFSQKQAETMLNKEAVVIGWEPSKEHLCYSASLEKNVPLELYVKPLLSFQKQYRNNVHQESQALFGKNIDVHRFGCLQANKISMLREIMTMVDANSCVLQGGAAND